MVSLAVVFEEISRAWMGVAGILGSHSLSCWMIAKHGTEEQRSRYLPELATGKRRTGIALTEPAAGSDLQGIQSTARRDGDSYVINGRKTWITNARHADPLPVLVKTDPGARPAHAGMSVFLVEAGTPGYEVIRDLPKLGYRGPETCELVLDSVRVPASALLGGTEGRGLQQVLGALETGRVNVAARAVGVAQEAYDQALRYAGEREAFGQKISGFQAVQLKLADMARRITLAQLLSLQLGRLKDAGTMQPTQVSLAKWNNVRMAIDIARECRDILGGAGITTEHCPIRHALNLESVITYEGTETVHQLVVGREVTGINAF
jgi:alkylation response protein AidB-like acyl-CoA dehydrogenase